MFQGADPGAGWKMTDPIFGKTPTLGACVPNIRRAVTSDDYIFSISGRVKDVKQYIVGGFQVAEKINMLSAIERFPENKMKILEDGSIKGNIIIDEKGNHLEFDYHTNHEKRVENYIIGKNPIVVKGESEIEIAREETIDILNKIFDRKGQKVSEIIGRWRKLDEDKIVQLLDWMNKLKRKA